MSDRLRLPVGEPVQTPVMRQCPVCDTLVDGATQVGGTGAQPEPGDVSVCLYCAAPLKFTATGFEVIPAAELVVLEASHFDFHAALITVRQIVKARGR